jgi:hypothetical protein
MVNELNHIPNPTIRERIERAIVKPILATKANFGLGLSDVNLKNSKITANVKKKSRRG